MTRDFYDYSVLCHHGVLGMKWGVRRYQNYDGTLIKSGSAVQKKTRYTNIDGSLNERGKLHAQKYINKQINKNNKYYEKYKKKYNKLAEKYKDNPELHKKFKDMYKDAERTQNSVNENIKKFGIDQIMANEAETRNKIAKGVGAALGVGALGAGVGVVGAAAGATIAKQMHSGDNLISAVKNIDYDATVKQIEDWSMTPAGKKVEAAVQAPIRTYADVKAYVASTYLNQTLHRLNQENVPAQLGDFISSSVTDAAQKTLTNLSNTANSTDFTPAAQNLAGAVNTFVKNVDTNAITNKVGDVGSGVTKQGVASGVSSAINSASNGKINTTIEQVSNAIDKGLKTKNVVDVVTASRNAGDSADKTANKAIASAAGSGLLKASQARQALIAKDVAQGKASASDENVARVLAANTSIEQMLDDPNYRELLAIMGVFNK